MMKPLTKELATAVRAARIASRLLLPTYQRGNVPARRKADRSLVTTADIAADRRIRRVIQTSFPYDTILSEEGEPLATLDHHRLWIIDPLDGTRSFVHHHPQFTISIALVVDGRIDVGVVAAPVLGDLFTAVRGRGAFCNGRQLRLGRGPAFAEALLDLDGGPSPRARRSLRRAFHLLDARAKVRVKMVGGALALASVAAGRLDGCLNVLSQPWDLAAGSLLVEEARGSVCTGLGRSYMYTDRTIVAGAPGIPDRILRVLGGRA